MTVEMLRQETISNGYRVGVMRRCCYNITDIYNNASAYNSGVLYGSMQQAVANVDHACRKDVPSTNVSDVCV